MRIVRHRVRRMLQMQETRVAGSKNRTPAIVAQQVEPNRLTIEIDEPGEVSHSEPDGADVHGCTCRKSRYCRGVWHIHARYIAFGKEGRKLPQPVVTRDSLCYRPHRDRDSHTGFQLVH